MDISLLFFFPCLKKWQTPLSCPHGLGPCARASANQWAWHRKHVTTVTSALQVLRTKCSPTQTRNARFWSNADSRPVHLGMCNNYYYIVTCDSMYSSSAYVLNVHDWQALRYHILAVSVVNIGGELPGLTLANGRGRSQAETLLIALWKNMMLSHSCRRVVC